MSGRRQLNFSKLNRALALFAVLLSARAFAADPVPGSACSVNNAIMRSGGPENSGVVHQMTCQGGVWVTTLTFLANSRVGIGTTASASDIDVSVATGGTMTLSRQATTVSSGDDIGKIQFWNNDSSLSTQNLYGAIGITAAQTISTDAAAGNMYFATTGTTAGGSPTTRMFIDSSGNVGIGTTSPQAILDIKGTGATQSALLLPRDTTGNQPTGVEGMLRYNTTTKLVETYQGGSYAAWGSLPSIAAKADVTGITTAGQALTTLFTPTSDGSYQLCVFVHTTAVGTGGTITSTLQYSTESGDTTKQINTNTLNATTLHGAAQSCTYVYTKAGTLVGFLSSGGAGAALRYNLRVIAVRMD